MGPISLSMSELGGERPVRVNWRDLCPTLDGIVFIIDAADRDRLQESKDELDVSQKERLLW